MGLVFRNIALLAVIGLTLLATGNAFAADDSAKLGALIKNLVANTNKITTLQQYVGFMTGIFFFVLGLLKFKAHVENPSQNPFNVALRRILAGAFFLMIPYMGSVVQNTVGRGLGGAVKMTGSLDASKVTAGALDGMIVAFVSDIAMPIEKLLSFFCYVMAIGLLMVGFNRLTQGMDKGPRGPAGLGTVVTFVIAGVLFNWGHVIGAVTNTIFDTGTAGLTHTVASIDPKGTLGFAAADAEKINQVIQALLTFVIILGLVAFIRGCLVLRTFADGGQASLAQGLTFIIGGALAVNLGDLVNALQATLGVQGITFH